MKLSYDRGQLLADGVEVAELLIEGKHKDTVMKVLENFTSGYSQCNYVIEFKNDEENLGIIVDVWLDEDHEDLIDSLTLWYEDYN